MIRRSDGLLTWVMSFGSASKVNGRSNNLRPVLHRIAFHWWGWRPAASHSRPVMCNEDASYWIWAIISSRFLKLFYDCGVREGENDVRICHWEFVCLLLKKEAFWWNTPIWHIWLNHHEIMNLFGEFQNQRKCIRSECLHWWCQSTVLISCVTTWSSSTSQWRPFGWKHCAYPQPPLPMTGFCLPWFFLCAMSAMSILQLLRGGRQFGGTIRQAMIGQPGFGHWQGPILGSCASESMCMPPSSSKMESTLTCLLFHNSNQPFKSRGISYYKLLTSMCKPFS